MFARFAVCTLLALSVALCADLAQAITRNIPAAAKVVTIGPATVRSLIVDGKEVLLTAGARIYNSNNLTIVPGSVPKNVKARALYDNSGAIVEVWILTSAEIAASGN